MCRRSPSWAMRGWSWRSGSASWRRPPRRQRRWRDGTPPSTGRWNRTPCAMRWHRKVSRRRPLRLALSRSSSLPTMGSGARPCEAPATRSAAEFFRRLIDRHAMPATNVLILLSDEHNARVMGCAGHPLVQTPRLDRLAREGTRFANAYTSSPICVPARASIATGRYVHEHRCWDNALAYQGSPPSWGHRMQSAGVAVESIGKLHYRNQDDDTGFDRQQWAAHILDGIGQVWGSVREPLPEAHPAAALFKDIGAGESSYNRFDRAVADEAVRWLHERAGRRDSSPWVLFVGLVAPHFPLIVPREYLDRYPIDDMPLPRLHPDRGYRRHPWVERHARFSRHDEQLGTDARRRLALASYLALTSFMDEQIGKVLDALAQSGQADRTTVVYSSDHGDNLGERGLWNK